MLKFIEFPSIESFYHNLKWADKNPDIVPSMVLYRGKVKLHGTNAAIRLSRDEILCQSRGQVITPTSDNVGFARWVDDNKNYWMEVGNRLGDGEEITVFGEWCGSGIMKGTSVSQIGKKVFAIFCIYTSADQFVHNPEEINKYLGDGYKDAGDGYKDAGVHVLPWHGDAFSVNYFNKSGLPDVVAHLNSVVADVELCDPWVRDTFGVSGVGEGVVYYPLNDLTYDGFKHFAFKAKGEKHKVVRTKEAVQLEPEKVESIKQFVDLFVTPNRLEQGLTAIGGELVMNNVGKFLAWMGGDIEKESKLELEESGLDWKEVQKEVQKACRMWFIDKSKAL